METTKRALLATLAGVEAVFSMLSPVLLVLMWITYVDYSDLSSGFLIVVAFLTSLYRAIKIGFLSKKDG